MQEKLIKTLFLFAALYDGALGAVFLVAGNRVFESCNVTPPNHPGYIQFPALLLLLFAVMFLRITFDPVGRRELMLYGCGLKIAYCTTVFGYQFTGGIPFMWIPWAVTDLVFLVLFGWAWMWARKRAAA